MQLPPGFQLSFSPSKLLCRPGAIETLAEEARTLGMRRVMLVSGTRTAQGRAMAAVRAALGDAVAHEWTGIPQHSGVADVTAMAAKARALGVDGFVAVGGGSASDSAKGAAILLAEGGTLADHANVFHPPDHYVQKVLAAPKLPIIAVPTTLSAAEVTPGLGVRDEHGHKLVFWDPGVVPRLIVLDALATVDVPAALFATTGMNALAHCIEGMYSRVRNPISEGLALQGIRYLRQALPRVVADPANLAAREQALVGAYLSGLVISNARVGIHHGICHGLGSLGGLSHGTANAVMLPHAMRFNREVAAEPLALAAQAMGVEVAGKTPLEAADAAIAAVQALQRQIGVPRGLGEAGLDRALVPALARGAMSDRGLYFNPRLASEPEVRELLESAW
ncbi:iron-containing alcohol dehydrogenase family protein [Hydrogenophaga sp. BPS33]|uniref:iron-containing alcohol dehydrogenase family protein n=1 Tax=Hydrogenophaga sp. BPS33 TaxID=2651974 RepID=UPI001320369B|nr:iron-containing alcohol dehydrogenase [Hydrogenophaga sp. BPS33]QHE85290.1 iron-containing alcohol dehydrogenase [Hydrogenophaga sp. BPS33]